jgi:integrase
MGRKKKSLIEKSPVKLRHRKLADGRLSLFLDRSVNGGHEYEFLQLYLIPEISTKAKRQNAQTLRKAEKIQRERTEALLNTKVTIGTGHSSDMLLSDWMVIVHKNHEHRKARDLNGIDNARKNLLKFRADVKLYDVDKQFCLEYINWLRCSCKTAWGKPVTAKTASSYSTTLRTALNEAVRERLIASNPWNQLEQIDKIKVPESKRDFLTIEEIKKMIATPFFNEQIRQAYLFSCFCGLRISDIRKLRWRDISTSGGQWLVSVVMTKTTNPVYIPLSSQAVRWLPEHKDSTPDDLVFGELPNASNLCVNLKSWAKKAGVKKNVTFHTARHSCAVLLLTLGADIYTVSKILGHRSVRATQIYAKIVDKKKDDAIALVDKAF